MVIRIISWIFATLFFVIGVLNLLLVHPAPGIFYLLLALAYILPVNGFLERRLGSKFPVMAKIAMGLVVLWGTLAVTDLADILGL